MLSKLRHYIFITFILSVCTCFRLQAADYYSCNFEKPAQNNLWVLNPNVSGVSVTNKWHIGSAINNGGTSSMYISADGGANATYISEASCIVAYVELTLDPGEYLLSFDWIAVGNYSDEFDGLYACWIPEKDYDIYGELKPVNINITNNPNLPQYVKKYGITFDQLTLSKRLNLAYTWENAQATIVSDGKPHKLAFARVISTSTPQNPCAGIDNIIITGNKQCRAPEQFEVINEKSSNDKSVLLKWVGDKDCTYEIRTYSYIDEKWRKYLVSDTTALRLSELSEGYRDFYVYRVCGRDEFGDTVYSTPCFEHQLIYYSVNHCMDYLDLSDDNCYYATMTTQNTNDVNYINGMIDDGPVSVTSRHSVCKRGASYGIYDPFIFDPRTGERLKMIPDGEIASIRLGNICRWSQTERVEFEFVVDSFVNPMVLLKYAIVLEDPQSKHEAYEEPRFTMNILNERHRPLPNVDCVSADFIYSDSQHPQHKAHWHPFGEIMVPEDSLGGGSRPTTGAWKDWTTVGVNLKDYHGQKVIIQLTTYDCAKRGHFAYAYFVLTCSKGDMDGLTCGQINTSFTAPDGFDYRWYKASDYNAVHQSGGQSLIISNDQTFNLISEDDTCRYAVDCMFPADNDCFFTLYASSLARLPKPLGEYRYQPSNCRNKVVFTGKSYVEESYHKGDINISRPSPDKELDYVWWDFGDNTSSTEESPTHIYPDEGGTFRVKLHTVFQTCEDSLEFDLNLPAVGKTINDINDIGCKNHSYNVHYVGPHGSIDKKYYESGVYLDTLMSYAGCDSIFRLQLDMIEPDSTVIDEHIISDQTYKFNNGTDIQTLNESGIYYAKLKSQIGCDSIVVLNLHVHDRLQVSIPWNSEVCAGENIVSIPFTFNSGWSNMYSISSDNNPIFSIEKTELPDITLQDKAGEIIIALPDTIRPDIYPINVVFHDAYSGNADIPTSVIVHYPDTILVQKWNDVLAIRDSSDNGGYVFTAYQWYKDNEKIDGATLPYLYVSDKELEMDDVPYYVELSRVGAATVTSCPFYPSQHTPVSSYPHITDGIENISVSLSLNAKATLHTISGIFIKEMYLNSGDNIIALPSSGIYILTLTYPNGNTQHLKIMAL